MHHQRTCLLDLYQTAGEQSSMRLLGNHRAPFMRYTMHQCGRLAMGAPPVGHQCTRAVSFWHGISWYCCVGGCAACSAKALSKYTDMVDSVSREQLNKLADATDAARLALKQVGWTCSAGKQCYCGVPVAVALPAAGVQVLVLLLAQYTFNVLPQPHHFARSGRRSWCRPSCPEMRIAC